eukprot:TRINITY_DN7829_c0_g2_i1.p1 TRINITY_DN7829_c0_g2~~TRINITY_DN7829_c0_g2_i1.p1  ORF type:complete len:368 (+),score=62.37 TRINITY_DN7829_c0_g2_i1:43-1146(+)
MFRRSVARWCTGPAKKRGGVKMNEGVLGGVSDVEIPRSSQEGSKTKFTMDELEERLQETAKKMEEGGLNPEAPDASEVLQNSYRKFKQTETQQQRISEQDGLFNMTPAGIKAEPNRAVRKFYKNVDVEKVSDQWWAVKLDKRSAKFFESEENLILPTEEFALAVAKEWDEQDQNIQKFSMPLCDVASGSHQVQPDGVANRLEYSLEFFKHDHLFYRAELIRDTQDELIEPILEWADRVFDIQTPRIEGIRRAVIDPEDLSKLRNALVAMDLNKYQLVAMTVMCQYMSSLILPLAVVHGACSVQRAIDITRIEEMHNIRSTTEIEGYHDVRHADSIVKIAACHTAWCFTKNVSPADCYADPALLSKQK